MDLRNKILDLKTLQQRIIAWKIKGETVVFTNGCFDIIHQGHLHILRACCELGSKVVVGLNADISVKMLKGESRPIKDQATRAELLAALTYVDAVVIFEQETPQALIEAISIDFLVKGGDYEKQNVVGSEWVEKNGGKTIIVPFLEGFSSTKLIERF